MNVDDDDDSAAAAPTRCHVTLTAHRLKGMGAISRKPYSDIHDATQTHH